MWLLAGIWCATFDGTPACDATAVSDLFTSQVECEARAIDMRAAVDKAILLFGGRRFILNYECIKVLDKPT